MVDKIVKIFTFIFSTNRLAARLRNGEDTITFDKDDDDALDFVTASSNLRSFAYGIDGKTRWEIKGLKNSLKFSLSPLTYWGCGNQKWQEISSQRLRPQTLSCLV
jgi:Ubiquitin-activating enzyme active site